jgi:transcriptional regulator with XRE-family HTH domain
MGRFDVKLFAKHVKEKRGKSSLRDIASKLQIGSSTLGRIESGHYPDVENLYIICNWLGNNPSMYMLDDGSNDDPIVGQLRAAANMSAETASAFMDIIRAAYAEILESVSNEDMA